MSATTYALRICQYMQSNGKKSIKADDAVATLGHPPLKFRELVKYDERLSFESGRIQYDHVKITVTPNPSSNSHGDAVNPLKETPESYLEKLITYMTENSLQAWAINEALEYLGRPPQRLSEIVKKSQNLACNGNNQIVMTLPIDSTYDDGYVLVNDMEMLQIFKSYVSSIQFNRFVTIDVEYEKSDENFELILLQIGFRIEDNEKFKDNVKAVIFDVPALGDELRPVIQDIFQDKTLVCHDGRMEVFLLKAVFDIEFTSIIDTQIVYESLTENPFIGLQKFLEYSNLNHVLKKQVRKEMNSGVFSWKSRPISTRLLEYAAADVTLLHQAIASLFEEHSEQEVLSWKKYSLESLVFNQPENPRYLSMAFLDGKLRRRMFVPADHRKILHIDTLFAISDLGEIMPKDIFDSLNSLDLSKVRDVVFDIGQKPRIFTNKNSQYFMSDDYVVDSAVLKDICSNLNFDSGNRAVLDGSLHRISAFRDLEENVYGLTVRLGRFVKGVSTIISDLLHSDKSILFLGPPGTGKSTFLRDAIRILSKEDHHLIVVDTSNELCGNGHIVHPELYPARRMMVPSLAAQKDIMVEAVQNHTPDIIVIDEIGRSNEVGAALTVKRRGVRILASAHGEFRKLMANKDLNGLLGGFQSVILSDKAAGVGNQKTVTERCGEPVFDAVIQLHKSVPGLVTVIDNVAAAADCVLTRKHVPVQHRKMGSEFEVFVRFDSM